MQIDHMILAVNELEPSLRFYLDVLGFADDGDRPPFRQIRVDAAFVILLAPFPTEGGVHLAFSMEQSDFEAAFERIRAAGIPYGDVFDGVGNMRAPGAAEGARGGTRSLYCMDPSRHLIELAYYA